MATSGSTDYNVDRNDIIDEALEQIGRKAAEQTIPNAIYASCGRSLNMLIKAWGAEGIGLWKDREIAVFQAYEGYSIDIGPSGDHATESYVKTEIETAAASGDATIEVDSISGITNGDYIGIELDDKTLQWTTINGVPAGTTITLTAVLTDAAAVDNHVYTYTTKAVRPLGFSEARVHYGNGDTENSIEIIGRKEYMEISNKLSTGVANSVYYDPQLTDGVLKVWSACNDVKNWLMMTAQMPIEDFDAGTDDADFAQEWFLPLSLNLAVLIAPKFGVTVSKTLMLNALYYKNSVASFDNELTSTFFGVDR
uniref:Putative structural protein n=1 Tax=viral metagenome TaxID=1070528 RepID=A0A6M3ILB3_9ZZZZ